MFRSNLPNKLNVQKSLPEERLLFYPQVGENTASSEKLYNVLDLLKTSNIRIITGALCLIWWVSSSSMSHSPLQLIEAEPLVTVQTLG